MWLLYLLLFPAITLLVSFSSAQSAGHTRTSDFANIIQYEKMKYSHNSGERLEGIRKRELFENGEKKVENEGFNMENFMLQEQALALSPRTSSMIPIYKRTEFHVLSVSVALYWIVIILIGSMIAIYFLCIKSRSVGNEDGVLRKKEPETKEDGTEEAEQ